MGCSPFGTSEPTELTISFDKQDPPGATKALAKVNDLLPSRSYRRPKTSRPTQPTNVVVTG